MKKLEINEVRKYSYTEFEYVNMDTLVWFYHPLKDLCIDYDSIESVEIWLGEDETDRDHYIEYDFTENSVKVTESSHKMSKCGPVEERRREQTIKW